MRGTQADSDHVHLARGARIKVKLAERHRFELDGGMKGRERRLDVRVVPASLSVVGPDSVTATLGTDRSGATAAD